MNRLRSLVSALALSAVGLLSSLHAGPAKPVVATAAPIGQTTLTATLVDPLNMDLHWKTDAQEIRGCLVEYTSDLHEEYVILAIVSADTTTFRHPDLAPQTKFYYRIRPFIGEVSAVAGVTTGKSPSVGEIALIDAAEPVIDSPDAVTAAQKKSLRKPSPAIVASPSELTATLSTSLSVVLRWKDRANDEDGYLVEAAAPGQNRFDVIAFLPPDTVGFTVPQLPPETDCRFRVRAFFYGPSSDIVEKITGAEPAAAPSSQRNL